MGQKIPKYAKDNFRKIELEELDKHYRVLSGGLQSTSPRPSTIPEATFVKFFLEDDPELAKLLWRAFDHDKDGKIDLSDFLHSMTICKKGSNLDRRKFVFSMLSQNGKVLVNTLKRFFPEPRALEYCTPLWDFEKKHEKEIHAKKGETLILLNKFNDIWWLVQNDKGERGYIAANYVQMLPYVPIGIDAIPAVASRISEEDFLKWAEKSDGVNNLIERFSKFNITAPPAVMVNMSGPTNFRQVAHMGFDNNSGTFEVTNLPPEWKNLFSSAGITEQEASDPETAQYILQVLQEGQQRQKRMKRPNQNKPIPNQEATEAPLIPQSESQTTPIPPALPPRVEEKTVQNIEPTPISLREEVTETRNLHGEETPAQTQNLQTIEEPIIQSQNVPPPPPPPTIIMPERPKEQRPETLEAPPPVITNFLDDIKRGKQLKHVTPSDVPLHEMDQNDRTSMASILKAAMDLRRKDLRGEGGGNDQSHDSEEWSD